MKDLKAVIATNLRAFIESTGRTDNWIMQKAGLSEVSYYKLLTGDGDLESSLTKIINLFGISDPYYFHNVDFSIVKSTSKLDREQFLKNVPSSEQREMIETITILDDFISMIETLKRNASHDKNMHDFMQ